MTDWQPKPGDVVLVPLTVMRGPQDHGTTDCPRIMVPVGFRMDSGSGLSFPIEKVQPWVSPARIAALERVAEAAREMRLWGVEAEASPPGADWLTAQVDPDAIAEFDAALAALDSLDREEQS